MSPMDGGPASATPSTGGLLDAFISAARTGNVAELERLFAAEMVSKADAGGFIRAAQTPVAWRERVAKYLSQPNVDRPSVPSLVTV